MGPFKYPSRVKGIVERNLYDMRVVLEIFDEKLIKDIIMTNKSKTNLDNIDSSIIKFIDETKKYFKIGNEELFSNYKSYEWPGILNMTEYLHEKTKKRQLVKNDKANYQPWKSGIYFGIMNCNREDGISARDNRVELHFGYTGEDPKHRDTGSGLGVEWRRIYYSPINSEGSVVTENKRACEYKIYKTLNEKKHELGIVWNEPRSKEYFTCPKENMRKIFKIVRDVIEPYEEWW